MPLDSSSERGWPMKCNCKTRCKPCRCRCGEDGGERLKISRPHAIGSSPRSLRSPWPPCDAGSLASQRHGDGRRFSGCRRTAAGNDRGCLGSVPGVLAYAKIIRAAGFVRSARPERHACWLQVWELVDRQAAVQWLADHLDLPDPIEGEGATVLQRVLFLTNTANEPGAAAATVTPGMEVKKC